MKWTFARNDGGRDSGFHDAGVETFKGNFDRYLARELIQNSLDARLDPNKPVHVKFEVLELERSDIPDADSLKAAFARCAENWGHDKKAKEFFVRAESLSKEPKVVCLRVSDFNTTGVVGGDADKSKNWYHLIRCAGSSSKGGGEGGSFGIGKNAPFAASRMRTVLYSTFNMDGEHAFQGVSTLVSHKLPDGGTAQPTGFLGGERGESVRIKGEIPPKFLRNDQGLDITVLAFPAAATWQNDLVYSVLENFWPAIDFGDLEVSVGNQTINRGNLASLLESFSGQEDFSAHLYYRAFKQPTVSFPERLPKLCDVVLYLYAGDADLPKRVDMVRRTGMVVFPKQFRSVLPFCGVFMCRNEEGNGLLREMEPPRHDTWDSDHPEKGANKKIEAEYVGFIRECIRQLAPADDAKVITIPGLNRFLPDDDETPEDAFEGAESRQKEESPERSPLPEKIAGRKIDARRKQMQPDGSKAKDAEAETESGEGDGSGGGLGKGRNESEGGAGGGGGGAGKGDADEAKGGKGGILSKPTIPIRYRTYASNPEAGVYALTVEGQNGKAEDVHLVVWTVGDDQKDLAEILTARMASGEDVAVSETGILGPLRLPAKASLKIEIVLREPLRVAMEVGAHEA